MEPRRWSTGASLALVGIVSVGSLAACALNGNGGFGDDQLYAATASFEVIAGRPQRLLVGLSTKDERVLAGGTATFTVTPSNDTARNADGVRAPARYLGVIGMPQVKGEARIGLPSAGTGAYAATLTIPTPGIWKIHTNPDGKLHGNAADSYIQVVAKSVVPNVGDLAPLTENLTLSTPGVRQQWLDSLADEQNHASKALHSASIAASIRSHKVVVIVVSTPAYCVSRFCGPVTQYINDLASKDSDQSVAYVHLEVWRDFDNSVVNAAAATWMAAETTDAHEPWVFVVGRDGRIAARFDNLVDPVALKAAIDSARQR